MLTWTNVNSTRYTTTRELKACDGRLNILASAFLRNNTGHILSNWKLVNPVTGATQHLTVETAVPDTSDIDEICGRALELSYKYFGAVARNAAIAESKLGELLEEYKKEDGKCE